MLPSPGQNLRAILAPSVEVKANAKEWRVEIRLGNDGEEASYVYDLMQSSRLLVENKELLPLPSAGSLCSSFPPARVPFPSR